MGINVLSLCDGMSCGQIALRELGVAVDRYYASEIDVNAIRVTQANFPGTIQLGDVLSLAHDDGASIKLDTGRLSALPRIDLVMFGSPCRSLSRTVAGRAAYSTGLAGVSGLFYPCAAILRWIMENNNPAVQFLVENVDSSNHKDIQAITDSLRVEPMLIDSGFFSAQTRLRNYWTNIPIAPLPPSCPLVLDDIMDTGVPERYWYSQPFDFHGQDRRVCATLHIKGHDIIRRVYSRWFKCPTLTACRGGNLQKKVYDGGRCRKLTPGEYRRLQTVPDWYRMDVAVTHIYNMCGDGWTIAVICHILRGMHSDTQGAVL